MTTIAWDGKTLAVDSCETKGSTITSLKVKKLFLDVGPYKAVAITGSSQDTKPLMEWIKSGNKEQIKTEEFTIVAIDEKGRCHRLHQSDIGDFTQEKVPITEGAGANIALGAMDAGATAIEAIKIACKRNVYTGGKVQSYTHVV